MPVRELIDFAHKVADAARQQTLPHARASLTTEDKSGGAAYDPVTAADRNAERAMRALIERKYASHGIVGEELGAINTGSTYEWVLDPVDGTRSYVCGIPTWTTLIALLDVGQPVLGIIDAPALDERYIGMQTGSWLLCGGNREPLRASACSAISEARLSTTDPYLFEGRAGEALGRLRLGVRITRYGHDGYAYARLAAGSLDLVVECGLKRHDYPALIPVVRGAGGVFGDWNGGEDFAEGNVIAAATPQLYEAAVEVMKNAG